MFPGVCLLQDLTRPKEKLDTDSRYRIAYIATLYFFNDNFTQMDIDLDTTDIQSCRDAAEQVYTIIKQGTSDVLVIIQEVR
jgi:hypothetical protein